MCSMEIYSNFYCNPYTGLGGSMYDPAQSSMNIGSIFAQMNKFLTDLNNIEAQPGSSGFSMPMNFVPPTNIMQYSMSFNNPFDSSFSNMFAMPQMFQMPRFNFDTSFNNYWQQTNRTTRSPNSAKNSLSNVEYKAADTSYFDYNIEPTRQLMKFRHLDQAFFDKTVRIAKRINCDPADLLALMHFESARTMSPSEPNKSSGAMGLIQIMPETAIGLGTTVEKLERMSAVQQLDYVEKYLVNAKTTSAKIPLGTKVDAATLYGIVIMPSRARGHVLITPGSGAHRSNYKNLERDGDGVITKNDAHIVMQEHRQALGYPVIGAKKAE